MFDQNPIGPTGRFPDGKLNDDDRGELNIAIGTAQGQVVIEFGTPTKWTAFPPATARQVAAALWKHAHSLDGRGPTITIIDGG